ncbi:hypothetical protein PMIN02_006324 [Paraphaeosphaeria minitans]
MVHTIDNQLDPVLPARPVHHYSAHFYSTAPVSRGTERRRRRPSDQRPWPLPKFAGVLPEPAPEYIASRPAGSKSASSQLVESSVFATKWKRGSRQKLMSLMMCS